MAESTDRPRRPGGPPRGRRSGSDRPAKGTPSSRRTPKGGAPQHGSSKGGSPKAGSSTGSTPKPSSSKTGSPKGGSPRNSGARGRSGEQRLWTRDGRPARGDSSASSRESAPDRDPYGTKSVRARHDAPEIPEEVLPSQLDRVARAQLKTLSKENADEVARHLVMAANLIEENPELAHAHAVSAARRAGRIAVVRETLAITAYSLGDFALALRELRTYRRISGRDDQLPMMVDCERGLGRPERALELGRSVPRSDLPQEVQVELAISMSGARLDLGQLEAALVELQIPQLDPDTAFSWSPALFDAYATVLEDLGRRGEAETWFRRSDVASAALAAGADSEDGEIEVFEEDAAGDVMELADEAGADEEAGTGEKGVQLDDGMEGTKTGDRE